MRHHSQLSRLIVSSLILGTTLAACATEPATQYANVDEAGIPHAALETAVTESAGMTELIDPERGVAVRYAPGAMALVAYYDDFDAMLDASDPTVRWIGETLGEAAHCVKLAAQAREITPCESDEPIDGCFVESVDGWDGLRGTLDFFEEYADEYGDINPGLREAAKRTAADVRFRVTIGGPDLEAFFGIDRNGDVVLLGVDEASLSCSA